MWEASAVRGRACAPAALLPVGLATQLRPVLALAEREHPTRTAQRGAGGPRARTLCSAAHPSPPAGLPPLEPPPKKRLAVFVSGGGSNFRAIHAAFADGGVHGEVAVVVSNSPSCSGVAYAQSHGIPTLTYPAPKADSAAGLTDAQLVAALTEVRSLSARRQPWGVLPGESLALPVLR